MLKEKLSRVFKREKGDGFNVEKKKSKEEEKLDRIKQIEGVIKSKENELRENEISITNLGEGSPAGKKYWEFANKRLESTLEEYKAILAAEKSGKRLSGKEIANLQDNSYMRELYLKKGKNKFELTLSSGQSLHFRNKEEMSTDLRERHKRIYDRLESGWLNEIKSKGEAGGDREVTAVKAEVDAAMG
jgi:hypothetical protein